MDGRSGRHAGQKRTYKAVAEMYAFLPREAVTRFLMSCSDCQKRMHLQSTNGCANGLNSAGSKTNSKSALRKSLLHDHSADGQPKTALDIDYSLPLTTTIKRMRNAGFVYNVMGDSLIAPTAACLGFDGQEVDDEMISETETGASDADISAHNGDQTTAANSDANGSAGCKGNHSHNHNHSHSHSAHGFADRWNPNGKRVLNEDEEEDDDEDNDLPLGDRLLSEQSSGAYDPERLKAFNMFVRLFVDENLDRMVPISRQPKEKIQAIIESCGRQFPEFSERARKRIRTYLKSCRRTKRHKTAPPGTEAGRAWSESSTPTPATKTGPSSHVSYHLTSPMAEQILATACDNECQNAKRMRMGLKPISVSLVSLADVEVAVAAAPQLWTEGFPLFDTSF
ncbi:unnamed protein product [Medioppia subpectinata]|uniref:Nucleolar protein 4 helical domain-containing protein n=1 Tax=Medioppia subpectinata TaxID=1979941 RepID=A0A7R9KVN8_9ACAR|nr:unnamed protein product [Medioppia subpectinata]CAG2109535.1 unnamed protein product [Medioppia subpectinata]